MPNSVCKGRGTRAQELLLEKGNEDKIELLRGHTLETQYRLLRLLLRSRPQGCSSILCKVSWGKFEGGLRWGGPEPDIWNIKIMVSLKSCMLTLKDFQGIVCVFMISLNSKFWRNIFDVKASPVLLVDLCLLNSLVFGSPVLEPYLDLCLGEVQCLGQLEPPGPGDVLVPRVLHLQSQGLVWGESRPLPPLASTILASSPTGNCKSIGMEWN